MMIARFIGVHDTRNLSGLIVFDFQDLRFRTNLKITGCLSFGNFGVQRRPFCIRANSLKTESVVNCGWAPIAWTGIDGHVAGGAFLVTDFFGAGCHDNLVVVRVVKRNSVSTGYAHLVFRPIVVRLKLGQG